MKKVIQSIIVNEIPNGCIFDTHAIISYLIQKHSDTYLAFVQTFPTANNITLTVHGQIGQIINKFDNSLIEKQNKAQSWSKNIHDNYNPCTCWKKI